MSKLRLMCLAAAAAVALGGTTAFGQFTIGGATTAGGLLDGITGVEVTATQQGGGSTSTTSGALGLWEISGLAEGVYILSAEKSGTCFPSQVIQVNQANDAANQNIFIFGEDGDCEPVQGECNTVADCDLLPCRLIDCVDNACVDMGPVPCDGFCDPNTGQCSPCGSSGDCDDENPCTIDSCVDSQCQHDPVVCTEFGHITCTFEACDPNGAPGNCDGLRLARDHEPCDDGDPCTEGEFCWTLLCTQGQPTDSACCDVECDEGEVCCEGVCQECCDDGDCNDGDLCTIDACIAGTCSNTDVQCDDDGNFCNGTEVCNPNNGQCEGTGDPCAAGQICCEATDTCAEECCDDNACDDGDLCTTDSCVNGTCENTPTDCPDDGVFCNGDEFCNPTTGQCDSTGNPCGGSLLCCEDSDTCAECCDECITDEPCTLASCDNGQCVFTPICTGDEVCVPCNDVTPGVDPNECATPEICGDTVNACIYLMLDRTGSTNLASRQAEGTAALGFLSAFDNALSPPPVAVGAFGCNCDDMDQGGDAESPVDACMNATWPGGDVTTCSTGGEDCACTRVGLSSDYTAAANDIPVILDSVSGVGTHFAEALAAVADELDNCNLDNQILIFISDGGDCQGSGVGPNCEQDTIDNADALKAAGVEIFSILFSSDESDDATTLMEIASEPKDDHFFNDPEADDLEDILDQIFQEITCDLPPGADDCCTAECGVADNVCDIECFDSVAAPLMQCSGGDYLLGGMICGDYADPLGTGIEGATVTVECPDAGYSRTIESGCDPAGLWTTDDVPCGHCTVSVEYPCGESFVCFGPDMTYGVGSPIFVDVHDPEMEHLQNLSFMGEPSFDMHDLNGDSLTTVADIVPLVSCLFHGQCGESACPAPGCTCRGDCDMNGLFTIASDLECFTDCLFYGVCSGAPCGGRQPAAHNGGYLIGGVVYTKDDDPLGSAVAGMQVKLVDGFGKVVQSTLTREFGLWTMDDVQQGDYTVVFGRGVRGESAKRITVDRDNEALNQNMTLKRDRRSTRR